jgi:hypothetical protein
LIMLRTIVIAVAALFTCVGIGLIVCGVHAPGWQVLIFGVIVLIGTLFERHYRGVQEPRNGTWQRTEERFIDPSSGEPVEVLFDPSTGERRYVAGESRGAKDSAP